MSDDKEAIAATQVKREVTDRGARTQLIEAELKSICSVLREKSIYQFERSNCEDTQSHYNCRMYLKVLQDIHQAIKIRIAKGSAAQEELKHLN